MFGHSALQQLLRCQHRQQLLLQRRHHASSFAIDRATRDATRARCAAGTCTSRARAAAFQYIDCHKPNRTQPGHCTRSTHHHRTSDSRMVSRLVVIVHVLKVQNAPRPVRFGRVNAYLGASSCYQHGERVPPRRLELRRRPVVQVHITILVVRLV